jgi:hypothetical protein
VAASFTDPNAFGDAFRRAGSDAAEKGHELSMKMLEQAESNTRAVFAAMREMARAGSVSDVVRIQGEYVRDQGSRAVEQAREIGDLIARYGRATVGEDDQPKD